MSVVLIVAIGWLALAVALALFLGRTVRTGETREPDGEAPLPGGDPADGSARGVSRL